MSAVKPPRKPRKRMTVEEKKQKQIKREQTRFTTSVHEIFLKSGFEKINSKDIEIKFKTPEGNRTSELDGLYLYENIALIVEDTYLKSPKDHLSKKRLFAEIVRDSQEAVAKQLIENLPEFKAYYDKRNYSERDFTFKYLYFSMNTVGPEHVEAANRAGITVVERALANYFNALVKTIAGSAKYEILKFLDIEYSDIGEARISGGNKSKDSKYEGFLLPENNSTYPDGYKIISFYADPKSLLKKSYVLRKNSWHDPNESYQRIIDLKKIKDMRKYLSEDKRVYVNNIIATLPFSTDIQEHQSASGDKRKKQLQGEDLNSVKAVTISLPDEFNVVGLIDGQHRVFSYHEGADEADKEIRKLRERQNLLVTGIIYPDKISEEERVQFEARLFLEINDRQTKVKSALTQEIELIVNPYSITAISRAVLTKFSKNGALKEKLEEHVFDDTKKLKIASIVSYGLKPLLKLEGVDSLYGVWSEENLKPQIKEQRKDKVALNKYIEFSYEELNRLLIAAMRSEPDYWQIDHEKKMLTPTSINGLIRCLRLIIENKNERTEDYYTEKLKDFKNFNFHGYKSSHWNKMGIAIYEQYFA